MAKARYDDPRHETQAHDACLAEERFLFDVQSTLQKMLNDRDLRYRDLAKRLDVSEARVSQLFGEVATNLTIRTVAKIFHLLGETPALVSAEGLRRQLADFRGSTEETQASWSIEGADDRFVEVESHAQFADASTAKREAVDSKSTPRDWALADTAADQKHVA